MTTSRLPSLPAARTGSARPHDSPARATRLAFQARIPRLRGPYGQDFEAKQEITVFEDFDHTPAGMMADFPREYDLQTMPREAAGRFKFFGADLAKGPDFSAFLADYDAELRRLCGL